MLLIYFLALLDLCCCVGVSLVVVNQGCCLVVCRLLIAGLLLLGSTGSRGCKLQQLQHTDSVVVVLGLWSTGSVVVARGLSCSAACGIFLDQGSNLSPALAGRFFTTEPPGRPWDEFLNNHLLIVYISAFVVVALSPTREDMKIGFVVVFTQFHVIGSYSVTWKQFIRFPREIILIVSE